MDRSDGGGGHLVLTYKGRVFEADKSVVQKYRCKAHSKLKLGSYKHISPTVVTSSCSQCLWSTRLCVPGGGSAELEQDF